MNNAKINIIGTLTKDPALHETETSKKLVFTVAVRTKRKNKDGESVPNFYIVYAYDNDAEYLSKKLQKGTVVVVSGDFFEEYKYSDKNIPYQQLTVDAADVRPLINVKPSSEETAKRKEILSYVAQKVRDTNNMNMDRIKDMFEEDYYEEEDMTE